MKPNKIIIVGILIIILSLCGCKSEFESTRNSVDSYKVQREIQSENNSPKATDLEVTNIQVDLINSSSYSDNIEVFGTVKNNSSKTINGCTLKLYIYDDEDNLLSTEQDYCFDISPYGEDLFSFYANKLSILVYDNYKVEIINVY